MTIYVVVSGKSFLPEAFAYKDFLKDAGEEALLTDPVGALKARDAELFIRFGGFLRRRIFQSVPEIHEYHSASVGFFPRTKNFFKSTFSFAPEGYIFLNSFVEKQYHLASVVPRIYRDMGVESSFLNIRASSAKDYDLVYVGSVSRREGVLNTILNLASKGLKVAVAGSASTHDSKLLCDEKNVFFCGEVNRFEVYDLISRSRAGLNYCPDVYPLKYQTCTKVMEYLVAGIPIVSNNYHWIREHSSSNGYSYVDIRQIESRDFLPDDLSEFILELSKARRYCWENVLVESGFLPFVRSIIEHGDR